MCFTPNKNVLDRTAPALTQVGFLAVPSEFGEGTHPVKGSRICPFTLSGHGPEDDEDGPCHWLERVVRAQLLLTTLPDLTGD